MKKLKHHFTGFTLVELIIVITILAILATIAFVSFQSYTKDTRDSNRLATINEIEQGLQTYQIKIGSYPMPENYITILSSGTTIGYQGVFGDNNSRVTNFSKTPLDPLDNINYTYNVNTNLDAYQITGFFENSSSIAFENNLISKTYASSVDYSARIVKSFGKELGVLLVNTGSDINRPLQEKYNTTSFTGIDVKIFTGTLSDGTNIGDLKAVFNNKSGDNLSGTGDTLSRLENIYKQKMQVIMSSCPNGWSDLGLFGGKSGTTNIVTNLSGVAQNYRVCEGNSIITSSQVIMSSCPNGWSDLGLFGGKSGTTNIVTNLSGVAQNYRVCQKN